MKILVDSNILVDYLSMRVPYYENALKIVKLCSDKKVKGAIAVHSIPNLYYILRKEMDVSIRRIVIRNILLVFDVAGFDKEMAINALENEEFKDLEDCLQDECAVSFGADYIVTRNIKDFVNSKIKAVTPEEFLLEYQKQVNSHA